MFCLAAWRHLIAYSWFFFQFITYIYSLQNSQIINLIILWDIIFIYFHLLNLLSFLDFRSCIWAAPCGTDIFFFTVICPIPMFLHIYLSCRRLCYLISNTLINLYIISLPFFSMREYQEILSSLAFVFRKDHFGSFKITQYFVLATDPQILDFTLHWDG